MTGVNNQPGFDLMRPASPAGVLPGGVPTQHASPAGPIGAPAAFPIEQELLRVRQMLYSSNPADATVGLYQLEALAASHRAHVIPVLLEQLGPGANEINARVAIDVLQRLRAPEVLPYLHDLSRTAPWPSVRVAATSAYNRLTGTTTAGAPAQPPAQPAAQPGGYPAPAPVQPPMPLPPAPTHSVDPAYMANLTPRLLNPTTAPAAAVELAQLPTAAILAVTGPLVSEYQMDPRTLGLLTTILAHRAKDPQAAALLRTVIQKGTVTDDRALSKAALGLLSTRNPAYLGDLLKFLTLRSPELAGAKRVIIEKMMQDPRVLAMPAVPVVMTAVLNEQESPELAAAASATLARVRTAQARDALAASPLFLSSDSRLRLQAVLDLGAHPAPYPAGGMQALMGMAQDTDPHVAAAAQGVLARAQAQPAQ